MWFFNRIIDVFDVIYREGEKEMLDESKYKEMLNELYEKLDSGEIDEETYEKMEGELLNILREIREYKRENQIVD